MLRVGSLKTVYHGAANVLTLKELVRNYNSLVEDATRVMLRIKALFRARAIRTPGRSVYSRSKRIEWLDQLQTPGARVRAESLLTQLDMLLELRPKAKTAMIAEARKQPGWKPLRSIPFLGVVRVAQLLAIVATPHRFRTKRNLWPYAGLAVVTRSSADQEFVGATLRRSARAPRTRELSFREHEYLIDFLRMVVPSAGAQTLEQWITNQTQIAGGMITTYATNLSTCQRGLARPR